VTGDGGVSASPAFVVFEHGRVVATGTGAPPPGAHDLGDAVLVPGLVDLQVNGIGDVDFAAAPAAEVVDAVDELARRGVTACLPTLVSAPLDAYPPALDALAAVRARRPGVLGVHLEGPFLGRAPGAHPPELLQPAALDWLLALCDRHPGLVRVVTLAPEADPGLAATAALAARGVVVALGHSTATYDEAVAAADVGARLVTHVFNGMGPFHHREPGLAGAALDDVRLVPTLIADLVHVHAAVVRLVLAARRDAVVVSDAVGRMPARDGAARLADGTLAGALSSLDEGVRNLVRIGVPLPRAVRCATGNAARVLGAGDRGRLAPGCVADLVALDPASLAVRAVWVSGAPLDS
jgi:N-acetylglucosamine-6-phosphate deacetylase